MRSKFIKYSLILLSGLTISSVLHAELKGNRFVCPSLDTVREYSTKIEIGITDTDGSYHAYSDPIIDVDKKIALILAVNYLEVGSTDEAVKLGQKMVRNINTQLNQYPYKYNLMGSKMGFCAYDNNVTLLVMFFDSKSSRMKWNQLANGFK